MSHQSCNLKVDIPQDLLRGPQLPPRGVVLSTKNKSLLGVICVEISDPPPNAACGTRSQDNQWGGNSSQRDISVQFAAMTVNQRNFSSYSDTPRTPKSQALPPIPNPPGPGGSQAALSVPGVHIELLGQLFIERPTHRWELRSLEQRDPECVSSHLLSNSSYQQSISALPSVIHSGP